MAPTNYAAIIKQAGKPVVVSEVPYTAPQGDDMVIKATAYAINPVDVMRQADGLLIDHFPARFGCDMAGTVEAVGPDVLPHDFRPGDRVFALGARPDAGEAYAAFQAYPVVKQPCVARIPDGVADADAVVLPLAMATATAMLFGDDQLGLEMPATEASGSRPGAGKTVLVWGGASSVGACCIMLATAAGYDVVTTASARNADFCRSLGAGRVCDYSSATVAGDLAAALAGPHALSAFVGVAAAIGFEAPMRAIGDLLARLGSTARVSSSAFKSHEWAPPGTHVTTAFAISCFSSPIGIHVFRKFLTQAIKDGTVKCKPDADVVGTDGLHSIQHALDIMAKGVSAKKLVVTV